MDRTTILPNETLVYIFSFASGCGLRIRSVCKRWNKLYSQEIGLFIRHPKLDRRETLKSLTCARKKSWKVLGFHQLVGAKKKFSSAVYIALKKLDSFPPLHVTLESPYLTTHYPDGAIHYGVPREVKFLDLVSSSFFLKFIPPMPNLERLHIRLFNKHGKTLICLCTMRDIFENCPKLSSFTVEADFVHLPKRADGMSVSGDRISRLVMVTCLHQHHTSISTVSQRPKGLTVTITRDSPGNMLWHEEEWKETEIGTDSEDDSSEEDHDTSEDNDDDMDSEILEDGVYLSDEEYQFSDEYDGDEVGLLTNSARLLLKTRMREIPAEYAEEDPVAEWLRGFCG